MKILIIDDNATHRLIYRTWLEKSSGIDYQVIEAPNAKEGTVAIITEQPDCVVLDFIMRGEDGFQMLYQIKHDLPECPPIIFVTCALTEDMKRNVIALGAYGCFDKSKLNQEEFCKAVHDAVGSRLAK
jgi:CheY-like chemotaxis protein